MVGYHKKGLKDWILLFERKEAQMGKRELGVQVCFLKRNFNRVSFLEGVRYYKHWVFCLWRWYKKNHVINENY